jgi:hypothetical protein
VDRLKPLLNGGQLLRGFLILAIGVVASYFIAQTVVGPEWGGFATTILATVPLLVWVFAMSFKKQRQDFAIERVQLQSLGSPLVATERVPFGFVTASDAGLGVTYFPMTEVLLHWKEIKSITLCQFGKILQHKEFDSEVSQPQIRSWSKPVIIVQTSRSDFPRLPIVFDNMNSAVRWIKILEAQQTPTEGFHRNAWPWKKRFSAIELAANGIGLLGCVVSLGINVSPLPHTSENAWFLFCIGGQAVSALSSIFGNMRESGSIAILQTMRPKVDKGNPHRIARIHPEAGAIWISEESNPLERISVESIREVAVDLKKAAWSDDLFQRRQLNHAELTLHLTRAHDNTRKFMMSKEEAELSVAALLAARPDLQIIGGKALDIRPAK